MTRDVSPGIEGIMQQLVLSPDNRYAAAYTNNNQVSDFLFHDKFDQVCFLLLLFFMEL